MYRILVILVIMTLYGVLSRDCQRSDKLRFQATKQV
jgi:hypothetical protein